MRVLLALLLMLALSLAGCTSDDDAMDDGHDDGDASGTMPAGQVESKTHQVSIENFAFGNGTLTITQGDTVVWANNDGVAHTVDSTDGGPLDSGNIAAGATFEFTFDDAGTFAYRCDIHPSMTAEIVVESLAAV